jgi:hypothetical protein
VPAGEHPEQRRPPRARQPHDPDPQHEVPSLT